MLNTSNIPHLKDYPYNPPKKIMPLTNYSKVVGANSGSSIGCAIGNTISTNKTSKQNRLRSTSDLSESPSYSSMESCGSSSNSGGSQGHHIGQNNSNSTNNPQEIEINTPATTPGTTPAATPTALYASSFNMSLSGSPSRSASGSPINSARNSKDLSPKESFKDLGPKDSLYIIPPICQIHPPNDLLTYLEPNPVLPPDYSTLPPNGCPKFPIMEPAHDISNETLPDYTPSIYKVIGVSRKLEWLNPYEPSTSRSWKNVIMELNSTQVNFYMIPSHLELHLLNFQASTNTEANDQDDFHILDNSFHPLKSSNTKKFDYEFFKCCQRLNLINDQPTHDQDSVSTLDPNSSPNLARSHSSFSLRSMSRSRSLSVNSAYTLNDMGLEDGPKPSVPVFKKLIRSYSLQHCKIGLATDYKKKSNCLRLRIENEQMLINFDNIRDLINWNLYLNIGKDLSLDLTSRDIPRYRTVPRRRRRREIYANYFNDSFGDGYNSLGGSNENLGSTSSDKLHNSNKSRRSSWSNQRLRSNSDSSSLINQFKSKFRLRSNSQEIEKRPPTKRRPTISSITEGSVTPCGDGSVINSAATSCNTSISDVIMNDDCHDGNDNNNNAIDDGDEATNENNDNDNDNDNDNENQPGSTQRTIPTPIPTPSARTKSRSSVGQHNLPTVHTYPPNHLVDDEEEGDPDLSDINSSDDEDEDMGEDDLGGGADDTLNAAVCDSDPEIIRLTIETDPQNQQSSFEYPESEKWQPTVKNQTRKKYYKNCLRCIKPLTMEDTWVSKVLVKPTNLNPNYTLSNSRESLNKLPNHYVKEFVVGSHGLIPRNN